MGRWLTTRLLQAVLATWLITSLVFVLSRLAADPAATLFEEASSSANVTKNVAAAEQRFRQALLQRLDLSEPVFYVTRTTTAHAGAWHWHGTRNQYHRWVVRLLHGQLGRSFRDGQPVGPQLRAALATTIPLTGLATAVTVLGSLSLGLALAAEPQAGAYTGWRAGLQLLLTGVQSLPLFTLALGLLFLFANPDMLNLLPAHPSPSAPNGWLHREYALRLVLPLLALVVAALPEPTLLLAASLRDELRTGYATTARAKGLAMGPLLRRHALPNALLPLLTSLAGLLPTLVAGAVVVETIFALPGMGRLLAGAVAAHDYPVVVAAVLLTAAARLLALAVADVLSALADPRIRLAS